MAILRKKFFSVEIPLLDTTIEVISTTLEGIAGRIVKLDLTRHLRGKNLEATFVIKVEDNKAIAQIKGLRLLHSYIARSMRKNISYVEDSFSCNTKEGSLRIKPFMITRKRVHRSVRKALRDKSRQLLGEFCLNKDYNTVFDSVISGELQKFISIQMKKIYPLAFCEIRSIQKQ